MRAGFHQKVAVVGIASTLGVLAAGLVAHGAQCGSYAGFPGYPLQNGTSLKLVNQAKSVFSDGDLETGVSKWSGCPGYGTEFPAMQVGGSGRPVYVKYVPSSNPDPNGPCEDVVVNTAGGTLIDATITLYLKQGNGTSCAPVEEDIGHALGHVLGLDDRLPQRLLPPGAAVLPGTTADAGVRVLSRPSATQRFLPS